MSNNSIYSMLSVGITANVLPLAVSGGFRTLNCQTENKSNMEHENLNTPQNPPLQQTAVGSSISWVKKEDFTPIEGQFYWVIIPNPESDTGFYIPYSAQYKNGYYITDEENEVVEIDNNAISHVSLIVYPL